MPGFAKLWRDYVDHEVFQDESLWRLFTWCLCSANYRPSTVRGVRLEIGEFVVGRVSSSKLLKMPEATFDRRLKRLETMGLISRKTNSMFTVVKIIEIPVSDAGENSSDTASDTAGDTATDTANEQPLIQPTNTEGEGKNLEGENKNGAAGRPGGGRQQVRKRAAPVEAADLTIPDFLNVPEVLEALERWFAHKRGIGDRYKTAESAQAIFRNADWQTLGPEGFVVAVDWSIGNNWRGIYAKKGWNPTTAKPVIPEDPRGNLSAREEYLQRKSGDGE